MTRHDRQHVIWVVGASEGIGRCLAVALSKQGHHLILSARNEERLKSLAAEIGGFDVVMDATSVDSVENAWNTIQSYTQNGIDMVIYCSGHYKPLSAVNMDLKEVESMIDVNLTGVFRVLNFIIPNFVSQKKGKIVLIGSVAGFRGLPNAIGYGASKAGLIHLAENLRCDLASYGIKTQVINPGFVKTRLTAMNNFDMPSLLTSEEAAYVIVKKIESDAFESRFPFLFANFLKFLSMLPYFLYFKFIRTFFNKR
jgi:short-subunit dehydrogenase